MVDGSVSYLVQARAAWRLGHYQQALQNCSRAVLQGGRSRRAAVVLRAHILLEMGDSQGALDALEGVAGRQAKQLPALDVLRGRILLEMWRLNEASAALQSAVRLQPNLAEAHHLLGLIAELQGDSAAARGHARRARSLQPRKFPAIEYRSRVRFANLIHTAMAKLSQTNHALLEQIGLVVMDMPPYRSEDQIPIAPSPRLLGMCLLPHPNEATNVGMRLVLFKRNLERAYRNDSRLVVELARMLEQAIGQGSLLTSDSR